jgi:DNA repair protein RadC
MVSSPFVRESLMPSSNRLLAALADLLDRPDPLRARHLVRHLGGLPSLLEASRGALLAAGLSGPEIRRFRAARQVLRGLLRTRVRHLSTPARVASLVAHLAWAPEEELWVIPVDKALRRLDLVLVAKGSAASCAATPGEILGPVLRTRAHGFFLVHNHPSGDPSPSELDRGFTRRLAAGCQLLSVRLEDHLVIGGDRWASVLRAKAGRFVPSRRAPHEVGPREEAEDGSPLATDEDVSVGT